jgi:hypothetical protein
LKPLDARLSVMRTGTRQSEEVAESSRGETQALERDGD